MLREVRKKRMSTNHQRKVVSSVTQSSAISFRNLTNHSSFKDNQGFESGFFSSLAPGSEFRIQESKPEPSRRSNTVHYYEASTKRLEQYHGRRWNKMLIDPLLIL
jgi:hypothetical protein